jgi:oligosaccharyltransferase complex subunit beta
MFIARGYELDFQSPKSDAFSLFSLGERDYDHILLFPPTSKAYGNALSPQLLLDFINAEGNILVALSGESATPSAINSLLLEFNIHLPPDRLSVVVDHFNYDSTSASERHDVLVVSVPKPLRKDVKNYFAGPGPLAVPRAVGQVLGNDSPLLAPILRAPSTAYSYNPKDDAESVDDLFAAGQQLALVTAMQARNSARFTVLGSVEMLEDKWFDAKVKKESTALKTGNREFAAALTGWTFKELGVLRVGRLQHHLSDDKPAGILDESLYPVDEINPTIYRIKNNVVSTEFLCIFQSIH